jgi:hypothetical protein
MAHDSFLDMMSLQMHVAGNIGRQSQAPGLAAPPFD